MATGSNYKEDLNPPPYTEFAEPPGSTQPSFHQPTNPHLYQYTCN